MNLDSTDTAVLIFFLWACGVLLAWVGWNRLREGTPLRVLCGVVVAIHVLALRFTIWFLKCVAIGFIGAFVYRAMKGESLLRTIQEPPRPVRAMGPAPKL